MGEDEEIEEVEPEEPEPVMGEPPKVSLTDEDKKIKFRTTAIPDLAQSIFNSSFQNFSMPSKDEGFDAIRYEWSKDVECDAYVRKFILTKKQTTRVEDLKPSEWFQTRKSQWDKAYKLYQSKLSDFKGAIAKKEAAKRQKEAEKVKKKAQAKAAAL